MPITRTCGCRCKCPHLPQSCDGSELPFLVSLSLLLYVHLGALKLLLHIEELKENSNCSLKYSVFLPNYDLISYYPCLLFNPLHPVCISAFSFRNIIVLTNCQQVHFNLAKGRCQMALSGSWNCWHLCPYCSGEILTRGSHFLLLLLEFCPFRTNFKNNLLKKKKSKIAFIPQRIIDYQQLLCQYNCFSIIPPI